MLHYGYVPKGLQENCLFRAKLLQMAVDEPWLRQALWEACKADLLFYVNCFVWTYDPRTERKIVPFITYPFQDEALLEIAEHVGRGQDLVLEKSRDMGASWMSLLVMEKLWHFHAGYSFLMVSRKEEMVDALGNSDSLFWKLDFIHRWQPSWLLPPGYNRSEHRKRLHFENPATGSCIDGEATTAAAGVGGRRTAMFIDEFSRIEDGWALLGGTADTTNCRIFNFTPWGMSGAAYALSERVKKGEVKGLRMHWSQHPVKAQGLYQYDGETLEVLRLDPEYEYPPDYGYILDGKLRSPWYDAECARRGNDREIAEMLDIDYAASNVMFFDRATIENLKTTYGCEPFWEGEITVSEDGEPVGLVEQKGGALKLWVRPDVQGKCPTSHYGGGADISTGQGASNSCFSIIDAVTGEKVAEYATPFLRPEQFALKVLGLCRWFRNHLNEGVLLAWEHQGPGVTFGNTILQLGYRRIHYRSADTQAGSLPNLNLPGWRANLDSKRLMLDEYRSGLSLRQLVNRSRIALDECLFFVYTQRGAIEHKGALDDHDPTGARLNHGDRVTADALAWKMVKTLGVLEGVKKKKSASQAPQPGSLAWRRELVETMEGNRDGW